MDLLPDKDSLFEVFGTFDHKLMEYYGVGFIGRVYSWIFRSRLTKIKNLLTKKISNPKLIIDAGCGSMIASFPLTQNSDFIYLGIDVIASKTLKKYRDAMRFAGAKVFECIKASVEYLPFNCETFDVSLLF